jgi:hypothetical protein
VVRYPHILTVKKIIEGEFDDETGDYTIGGTVEQEITGRAEIAGSGKMITLNDGKQIAYNWVFYSREIVSIDYNAPCTLSDDNGEFWGGTVKGASKTQKGTRIWL